MDVDERTIAIVMLGVMAIQQAEEPRSKRRRLWSKEWLNNCDNFSHMRLVKELKENNPDDYRNYLRMPDESFQLLPSQVSPLITKKDTVLRPSIIAEQRLVATLLSWQLDEVLKTKFTTGISAQLIGCIIPETRQAIIRIMQDEYLKLPASVEEWKATAKQFNDYWNFLNCGSAIDAKHVHITPPAKSGSFYFNYKGYFSIVLMAIMNAKYEFIFVDIGKNGRNSDGGIIEKTAFSHSLKNGLLNLPSQEDTVEGLNVLFVADDAFAPCVETICP